MQVGLNEKSADVRPARARSSAIAFVLQIEHSEVLPLHASALGTTSHAADQLVSRDAVARPKLRCALELNRVR